MLYTGAPLDNTQKIGVAVSDDLYSWSRVFDHPVIRPEKYGWANCPLENGAACRDPYVVHHEDEYWMYYTATMKEGYGCVARAVSKDLLQWLVVTARVTVAFCSKGKSDATKSTSSRQSDLDGSDIRHSTMLIRVRTSSVPTL